MNNEVNDLLAIEGRIQEILSISAKDIVEIGKALIKAKQCLPHGLFGKWLQDNTDLSPSKARSYMQVAQRFGDNLQNLENLSPAALCILAQPSMPEAVFEMIESGEIRPTLEEIRYAKKTHKTKGDK